MDIKSRMNRVIEADRKRNQDAEARTTKMKKDAEELHSNRLLRSRTLLFK